MKATVSFPATSSVLRWVARVWSLLLAGFAVLRAITPDSSVTQPIPLEDLFLLGIWGAAIAGLVIAWRWEIVGAWLAIAIMFFRELVWVILKGDWVVNFLIVWALIVPPAILYLLAHRLEGRSRL